MINIVKPGQTYKLTQYEKLGGENGVRQLVSYFYQEMSSIPSAKKIRDMHASDLSLVEEKLFMFLSGWLGGPTLFFDKYGPPRLLARHQPFPIGIEERDQWLLCMDKALKRMNIEPAIHDELMQAFFKTADFMRNKEG